MSSSEESDDNSSQNSRVKLVHLNNSITPKSTFYDNTQDCAPSTSTTLPTEQPYNLKDNSCSNIK